MLPLRRAATLFFLVATTWGLAACQSQQPAPATTGSLAGNIVPAQAVTRVAVSTLTSPITTTFATPSAAGIFNFGPLPPGDYTLSFMPQSGYLPPGTQVVTVAAGATTGAAPTNVEPGQYLIGSGGLSYFKANTRATSGTATASLAAGTLQLALSGDGSSGQTLHLALGGFADAPATFYLRPPSSSGSVLSYDEQTSSGTDTWTTASANGWGAGTVVIMSVDSNPRRVSGTFEAAAYSGAGTSRIIHGAFVDAPY